MSYNIETNTYNRETLKDLLVEMSCRADTRWELMCQLSTLTRKLNENEKEFCNAQMLANERKAKWETAEWEGAEIKLTN